MSPLLFLLDRGLFRRVAGGGHERLLEGRRMVVAPVGVAAFQLLGAVEGYDPAVHHDADPVAQLLGLAHVVGAQQDRGIVSNVHTSRSGSPDLLVIEAANALRKSVRVCWLLRRLPRLVA